MRIDIPIWTMGNDTAGHTVLGFRRSKPTCPAGSKLAVAIDYLDPVTGQLTVVNRWVTDCYTNQDGETVAILDQPVVGKILGCRFFCVPVIRTESGLQAPDTADDQTPAQTNWLEGPTDAIIEQIAAFDADTCQSC